MKNLENNQFDINKTTMRELTPYELDSVAGGVDEQGKSIITITIPITYVLLRVFH